MGIPKFHRWLSERYPMISQEADPLTMPGIDNLYLDMNGIVHQAATSNNLSHIIPHLLPKLSLDKIWTNVFQRIEQLIQLIRPKNLLYIALDGVAPRAKINNQRERRFKSAIEIREHIKEMQNNGVTIEQDSWFDSNQITPGTDFMTELNKQIRYFIHYKIKTDTKWQKIKVIFSGSDVPGEGEHKLMNYLRNESQLKNNEENSNLRHCIYGLDADLIILGLISHQHYFCILREKWAQFNNDDKFFKRATIDSNIEYEMLYLSTLKDYLSLEFSGIIDLDISQLIDDFCLLMLFIGNDFLPRVPTFEIDQGAIDYMIHIYKQTHESIGYINSLGVIDWHKLQLYVAGLQEYEQNQIQKRLNSNPQGIYTPSHLPDNILITMKRGVADQFMSHLNQTTQEQRWNIYQQGLDEDELQESSSSEEEKTDLQEQASLFQSLDANPAMDDDWNDQVFDFEKLPPHLQELNQLYNSEGMKGIKEFYYKEAFGIDFRDEFDVTKLQDIIKKYLEGIQWVLDYYYKGCSDWQWFYPYYYAPMMTDLCSEFGQSLFQQMQDYNFQSRECVRASEQLFSVLPKESSQFMPTQYRELIQHDQFSQFFPESLRITYDFLSLYKNYSTQKLLAPFIDMDEVIALRSSFPNFEQDRVGQEILYQFDQSAEPVTAVSTIPIFPTIQVNVKLETVDYDQKRVVTYHQDQILTDYYFPTLKNFKQEYVAELIPNMIKRFQGVSRNESLILRMRTIDFKNSLMRNQQKSLFEITRPHGTLVLPIKTIRKGSSGITDSEFNDLRTNTDTYWKQRQGILFMPTLGTCLAHRTLKGFQYKLGKQGMRIKPNWAEEIQLTPIENINKVQNLPFNKVQDLLKIGRKVIITRPGPLLGSVGYIKQTVSEQSKRAEVKLISKPNNIQTSIDQIIQGCNIQWLNIDQVLRELHVSKITLFRLAGDFKLRLKERKVQKQFLLGLQFIPNRNEMDYYLPGYIQIQRRDYLFSNDALDALLEYQQKYMSVWAQMEILKDEKFIQIEQIFKNEQDILSSASQVHLWIKNESKAAKAPRCRIGSLKFPVQVYEQLAILQEQVSPIQSDEEGKMNFEYLHPQNKLWIDSLWPQNIFLGDRVINLNDSYHFYVPFGAQGTVIGAYTDGYYEVIFDQLVLGLKGTSRSIIYPIKFLLKYSESAISRVLFDQALFQKDLYQANNKQQSEWRSENQVERGRGRGRRRGQGRPRNF